MATGVNVLVSEAAFTAYGPILEAAAPEAVFLIASESGVHGRGGEVVEHPEPTVAWFSNDLFSGGSGAAWFVRLFVASPGLSWLHSSTAGLDNPLFSKLAERGVTVTGAHLYDVPVSEFVLRAVLDRYQRPELWTAAQRRRQWKAHDFREIAGTTWVIVGLGGIGRAIAQRGRALEARTIGVVRHDADAAGSVDEIMPASRLPEAAALADVLILAASATPGARPLIGTDELAAMPEGSLLINVARGSLVDEGALLDSLDRGRPDAAVLDVTATEPLPPDSPLWAHPRVSLSSHSAGQGHGRFARGAAAFAEKLARYAVNGAVPDD